jgi:hypothetical protein
MCHHDTSQRDWDLGNSNWIFFYRLGLFEVRKRFSHLDSDWRAWHPQCRFEGLFAPHSMVFCVLTSSCLHWRGRYKNWNSMERHPLPRSSATTHSRWVHVLCCISHRTNYKVSVHLVFMQVLGAFPSAGLLRGVSWFQTDFSGLPVALIFMGILGQFDP